MPMKSGLPLPVEYQPGDLPPISITSAALRPKSGEPLTAIVSLVCSGPLMSSPVTKEILLQ